METDLKFGEGKELEGEKIMLETGIERGFLKFFR